MAETAVPSRTGREDTRTAPETAPLHPAAALFSLGRPFGLVPVSTEVCPPDMVPFGLRRAVVSVAVPVGNLAAYGYDHERQIGTVRDGNRTIPLLRHTTGETKTTTNPDGHQGPDTDTDHRED